MNFVARQWGIDRAIAVTWFALVLCTVVSWTESTTGQLGKSIVLVVLSLTAAKVVMIMVSYMEIAWAPRWLQALCGGWAAVVFIGLSVILCALPS